MISVWVVVDVPFVDEWALPVDEKDDSVSAIGFVQEVALNVANEDDVADCVAALIRTYDDIDAEGSINIIEIAQMDEHDVDILIIEDEDEEKEGELIGDPADEGVWFATPRGFYATEKARDEKEFVALWA